MPVSTRSKTGTKPAQSQSRIDDFAPQKSKGGKSSKSGVSAKAASKSSQHASKGTSTSTTKRKRTADAENDDDTTTASKQTKLSARSPTTTTSKSKPESKPKSTSKSSTSHDQPDGKPIVINRAPVLHLWSACVAHHLHPSLPWPTCLSIGSSVAALCAISKGRALGKIDPPDLDPAKADAKDRQRSKDAAHGARLEVMGFPMVIRDGGVVVQGKKKADGEGALRGKFGDEGYARIKAVMEEALRDWKGRGEELDKKAFGMYESFRPNPSGGWGRKGELKEEAIRDAVRRE